LRVANKESLLAAAKAQQVELGSWFETPLHPVPLEVHHRFGYRLGQCPNAESAARETVNLPLHSRVSVAETARIVAFLLCLGETQKNRPSK
jgi:perosamine synthetase